MGVLDDAIREHLELKRQHGADEVDIAREEAEALGPARREPAIDPSDPIVGLTDEAAGAMTQVLPSASTQPPPPPPPGYEPPASAGVPPPPDLSLDPPSSQSDAQKEADRSLDSTPSGPSGTSGTREVAEPRETQAFDSLAHEPLPGEENGFEPPTDHVLPPLEDHPLTPPDDPDLASVDEPGLSPLDEHPTAHEEHTMPLAEADSSPPPRAPQGGEESSPEPLSGGRALPPHDDSDPSALPLPVHPDSDESAHQPLTEEHKLPPFAEETRDQTPNPQPRPFEPSLGQEPLLAEDPPGTDLAPESDPLNPTTQAFERPLREEPPGEETRAPDKRSAGAGQSRRPGDHDEEPRKRPDNLDFDQ